MLKEHIVTAIEDTDTGRYLKPAEYAERYLKQWRAKHPSGKWPSASKVQVKLRYMFGVEVSVRWIYRIIEDLGVAECKGGEGTD